MDMTAFRVGDIQCRRGPDGEGCLGTPTCDSALPLIDKGRADPLTAGCLGWLGSSAAWESGAKLLGMFETC